MKKIFALICVVILLLGMSALTWAQQGRRGMAYETKGLGEAILLEGEITNILLPLAKLKTQDKEYTVHLGPVWYWKQKNYELSKGPVQMVGVIEELDGERHLYPSKIIQDEKTIVLIDEEYPCRGYRMRSGGYCQDCGRRHHHHGGCRY